MFFVHVCTYIGNDQYVSSIDRKCACERSTRADRNVRERYLNRRAEIECNNGHIYLSMCKGKAAIGWCAHFSLYSYKRDISSPQCPAFLCDTTTTT